MRNQPFHDLGRSAPGGRSSLIDPPASLRFRLLAAAFALPAVVVLLRIAWVQYELQGRYLEVLQETTTEYETISARDGRILSATSEVFATDVDQYSIEVHYRWLQEPVDETWLRRTARSSLSRSERRDDGLLESRQQDIERQRSDMWSAVMNVTGLNEAAFSERREKIQTSVERVADAVNRRRGQKAATVQPLPQQWYFRFAAQLRQALTTSPARSGVGRIVVREEESYHMMARNVPLEVAAAIIESPARYPGVRVVTSNQRTYPLDSTAIHIVGTRTPAADHEETAESDERLIDWRPAVGRFGVEREYELQLQGVPGRRRVVRNRRMEIVSTEIERAPVSGRDLLLTINVRLQQHAEALLAECLLETPRRFLPATDESQPQPVPTGGSIVVMEAASGRVVAAASAPAFSPRLYTDGDAADWQAVNADPRFPFLSRTIQTRLPPGSLMKVITAAAALETRTITADEPFVCQGYLDRPDQHRCLIYRLYGRGHGTLRLQQALAQSCNVYFFSAARKMGFRSLRDWATRFGLGQRSGIDLPFERAGNLPGSGRPSDADRYQNETLGLAIGQSRVLVTPLQMARMMAAVANGGWLVTPHVVSPDGMARTTDEVDDRPRQVTRQKIAGLSAETLAEIRDGLAAVVQPGGSGHRTVQLPQVAIAGKTGTAQTGATEHDHAWFAGYVPADNPQYSFVVVLEHGGSGSRAAGPVARELVRKMWSMRLVGEDAP
ncbi:MAG: penicillin-binding transpeptidase domain-containing protein [Planctomycetaceae bacterium]|nr:penicillin-binding transpeptidase domain-containing protein [Planctomycetaceae bacterium]